MAVLIGHASISENNTVNGSKGDQTSKEVCTRSWYKYSGGWDFIAIHPDANVREKHAKIIEQGCANDNIGYGQSDRNTLHTQARAVSYDLSKITTKCNCDCSSFQHVAAIGSGGMAESTYGSNGMTTSTMKSKLQAAGYVIITDSTYCNTESYCVRGAIYVKAGKHTVCGLSNGSNYAKTLSKAGASSSGSSTSSSGSGSSSSGSSSSTKYTAKLTVDGEIGTNSTKRWQTVMGTTVDGTIDGQGSANKKYWTSISSSVCKWTGGASALIKAWQKYLIDKGYSCGSAGADGKLGKNTALASQKYLIKQGYSCGSAGADGEFGEKSAMALQNWLNAQ